MDSATVDAAAPELFEWDDPRIEEVRVAMALNGGVSLAVWMGGCAVELDSARRAHLAPEPPGENGGLPSRSIYNALCRAFARVLVLDLMSGTSAGGINGALLGAAICRGRALPSKFVRDRWLTLGDFSKILHRTTNPSPGALMQGEKFHKDLLAAFRDLEDDPATAPPRGQEGLRPVEVKLDITTTNLDGERRAFRDFWGRELVAREYRARFRFRRPSDYTCDNLAVAARASASFPIAFEPWRVECPAGDLAGFVGSRWVIDGGLLDNAPIGAVLDLIPARPAARQVRRFVCYLNADPPVDLPRELNAPLDPPVLMSLVRSVVNLPRVAPFVDQLTAIERATRRGQLAGDVAAVDLLCVDLDCLERTAESLFRAYCKWRRLSSLEEVLGQPAEAEDLFERHYHDDPPLPLPWVPNSLAPRRDGRWQWGIRTTQRALQLLVDLTRCSAVGTEQAERLRLALVGETASTRIEALEDIRQDLLDTRNEGLGAIETLDAVGAGLESFDPVSMLRDAAQSVFEVKDLLCVNGVNVGMRLFGRTRRKRHLPDAAFQRFLRRALAIEVVCRAINPTEGIESAQELRFAEVSPYAPSPIFAEKPSEDNGWATPTDKLTGLEVGHFAGFYRRSWRVNDFMWGRLDAAARIVDMMVAPGRARQLREASSTTDAAGVLADALVPPEPSDAQAWLLLEALVDAGAVGPDDTEALSDPADLRAKVHRVLRDDLAPETGAGELTRRVCIRAAQLEILAEELPLLDAESAEDRKLGAGAKQLGLPGDLRAAIESLRPRIDDPRKDRSLPRRLTAKDEIASSLALRTGTHAALVGLGMLRAAGLPLSRVLFAVRSAILPIAGSVARRWWNRLGVLFAFWAAAAYLTSRLITTEDTPAEVELITSAGQVVAILAMLAVIGVAAVPIFRIIQAESWKRRIFEGLWSVGFFATGAVAVFLLAWRAGELDWGQLVAAPEADLPPREVLYAVIAFTLGTPIVGIPSVVRGRADAIVSKPWGGWSALLIALAIVGLLLSFSISAVFPLGDLEWWQLTAAGVGLILAPIVSVLYLFVRPER
jgi:predicted acylesterase/phospholipase RssA